MLFDDMIKKHRSNMENHLNVIVEELSKRAHDHDLDKLEDEEMYATYSYHFPKLKQIDFHDEKYKKYEKEHMYVAQTKHVNNCRHHFYDYRANVPNVNLIDIIEAITDIYISQKQYDKYSKELFIKTLKKRGIFDMNLETLILNTIEWYYEY